MPDRLLHSPGRTAVLGAATLLLAACATGPRIFSNVSPLADFESYESYGFVAQLGTDDGKDVRSLKSQFLIAEVSRQMDARGYEFDPDDPDIRFDFDLVTREKLRSSPSSTFGGYYGYGPYPGYGWWGGYDYGNYITQYTEGSLYVSIVDTDTSGVVWEGVSVSRIDDEVRANLGESIRNAVAEMFANFPWVAPGADRAATDAATTS